MRSKVFVHHASDPAHPIDSRKLVRSVLQRIANLTGERIYSTDLSSDGNFVEPQAGCLASSAEKMLKHKSPISQEGGERDYLVTPFTSGTANRISDSRIGYGGSLPD